VNTVCLCPFNAAVDPLCYQAPLKLCHCRDDVKHQPTLWRGHIQTIGQGYKGDAKRIDSYRRTGGSMRQISMDEILAEFLKPQTQTALEQFWESMLPKIPLPDAAQWVRWRRIFGDDQAALHHGITCAARRVKPFNDAAHSYSYISAVALAFWNAKRQAAERERAA
jgi:hypothetical protein